MDFCYCKEHQSAQVQRLTAVTQTPTESQLESNERQGMVVTVEGIDGQGQHRDRGQIRADKG